MNSRKIARGAVIVVLGLSVLFVVVVLAGCSTVPKTGLEAYRQQRLKAQMEAAMKEPSPMKGYISGAH